MIEVGKQSSKLLLHHGLFRQAECEHRQEKRFQNIRLCPAAVIYASRRNDEFVFGLFVLMNTDAAGLDPGKCRTILRHTIYDIRELSILHEIFFRISTGVPFVFI